VEIGPETSAYDASAVKTPRRLKIQKSTCPVITVRPEHGYSATNYDGSPAPISKSLRGQFGQKYDAKKVPNSSGFIGSQGAIVRV